MVTTLASCELLGPITPLLTLVGHTRVTIETSHQYFVTHIVALKMSIASHQKPLPHCFLIATVHCNKRYYSFALCHNRKSRVTLEIILQWDY